MQVEEMVKGMVFVYKADPSMVLVVTSVMGKLGYVNSATSHGPLSDKSEEHWDLVYDPRSNK